jgi:hypothetical protein
MRAAMPTIPDATEGGSGATRIELWKFELASRVAGRRDPPPRGAIVMF